MLGGIVEGRSLLNKDETEVLSDYEVRVERLIGRGPATPAVGDTVTVRRQGGTVTVDNVEVVATENDFPQFAQHEKYVLFLKKLHDATYEVVYGPQGAFRIQDNTVRQVSEVFGNWNANRGVALADFIQEVMRHISQQVSQSNEDIPSPVR
jgi:hypothetical protein